MDELPEGAKIDFTAAMNSGQFAANRFRGQTVVLVLVFVLAFYGLILVLAKIFSFIRLIFSLFILPGTPLRQFGPPGSWAIITGASDGIGKEFALQLARQNFNLVLLSRTASKLEALAHEIRTLNPAIRTLTHAIDFSLPPTPSSHASLHSLLTPLDIAILINNVGTSHSIPVPFALTPEKELTSIIAVNCLSTLLTTQLILPSMLARRRGLILTMGSFGGLIPTPLLATYSGSKAFLATWSSALAAEVAPQGVTVQLVQSYLVVSAMSKVRRPSWLVPSPRRFVRSVLGKVGRSGGAQGWPWVSTPWWSHGVGQWVVEALVGVRGRWVVEWNKGVHEGIRRRALRKREREEGRKEL